MKNLSRKIPLILWLIVIIFSSKIAAQEKPNYITLNYILSKLTFTSRINYTNEEINNKLIKEIQERKVDFILTDEKEKSIQEAQGTDSLIKVIRENTPRIIEEEEKIKEIIRTARELEKEKDIEQKLSKLDEKTRFFAEAEILYEKFLKYRNSFELEKLNLSLQAGKEFLEKYGDKEKIKEEYREEFYKQSSLVIEYIKKQIPKLEAKINNFQLRH